MLPYNYIYFLKNQAKSQNICPIGRLFKNEKEPKKAVLNYVYKTLVENKKKVKHTDAGWSNSNVLNWNWRPEDLLRSSSLVRSLLWHIFHNWNWVGWKLNFCDFWRSSSFWQVLLYIWFRRHFSFQNGHFWMYIWFYGSVFIMHH